ncbi:MAG TPA: peptidylprolyl isomerase [Thermoanaerobaculia bacterium]|jgi:peptidyl-prolyl cis-trans isomerase D|nr:peptidylprolyl isomerase [Thermoanaerobaculia bacterium]
MLKVFRDNLKNLAWILWVIIALFVLALAVEFGGNVRQAAQGVAATVGGEQVTIPEFQRAYKNLDTRLRQVYGDQLTPEMAKQMKLPLRALDQVISQKILLAEARRLGLSVSDAEVREQILAIPGLKDDQGNFIGQDEYVRRLQSASISPNDFERELHNELLMDKLNTALAANLYVSEDEIQKAYREQVEKAKIRYIQLARFRYAAEAHATPAEMATYFQAHKAELKLPEQRDVAYLLVDGARATEQVKLTDQDLRSSYDANKAQYTHEEQVHARHILVMVNDKRTDAEAQARIQEAKKKIESGTDFAKVATEYSDDAASKASGGDLGSFGRNKMVKEFEDAAFNAQPHKLVGPVKSSFGYHLIEVLDKQPGGMQPFEQVKEMIRARLTAERAGDLASAKAKELAGRLARNKPRNADELKTLTAQNPGVTFGETGKFGAQDAIAGIGRNPSFSAAAFALKQGEVSEAVQLPQGWAILYLKEIQAPRAPELKDVEPRVKLAVESAKLQQITMQKLTAARSELATGKTLDQVAAELGAQVKETAEFGGDGTIQGIGYNPELAKAVMALPTGQIGGPVADAQGGLLFQVTDRKSWDPKLYASNREQTRSTLLRDKLNRLQGALFDQRRRELGVEYDKQFLQSLDLQVPQQG